MQCSLHTLIKYRWPRNINGCGLWIWAQLFWALCKRRTVNMSLKWFFLKASMPMRVPSLSDNEIKQAIYTVVQSRSTATEYRSISLLISLLQDSPNILENIPLNAAVHCSDSMMLDQSTTYSSHSPQPIGESASAKRMGKPRGTDQPLNPATNVCSCWFGQSTKFNTHQIFPLYVLYGSTDLWDISTD